MCHDTNSFLKLYFDPHNRGAVYSRSSPPPPGSCTVVSRAYLQLNIHVNMTALSSPKHPCITNNPKIG